MRYRSTARSTTTALALAVSDTFTQADIDAGLITYDHDDSQTSSDNFDFTVDDGLGTTSSATFTWTVTNTNDPPTAANNTVVTAEDTAYAFTAADFGFSDIDGDALASVQITSLETVGALQLSGVDVTLNQVITKADIDAGNLTFLPATDGNGIGYDTFGFTVNDGITDSVASYTMTIDVTPVNDEQILATNTGATVAEGSIGNVITNAMLQTTDVDNTTAQLVYTVDAVPINGTLYNNGVALSVSDTFTQSDIDAGLITYDHDDSQTSTDSFDFTVDDGLGTTSSATFTWTVTNTNDPPTAANNTVVTAEDTTYTFSAADFGFSDIDGDTLASVRITSLEAVGALQLSGVDVTLNQVISRADIDAGNLTYLPATDGNGVGYDSFALHRE